MYKVNRVMNKTQVETLIQSLKRSQNSQVVRLCEAFEAFMALYAARNQEHANPSKFNKKLKASMNMMWESFYTAAESFGINGQYLLQHLVNPANFSAEEMQGMRFIQRSLEAIKGPAPAEAKKTTIKNVRI